MARISFFVVLTVLVLFMGSSESVDSESFFPPDLTSVTWAHGANSQADLAKAFNDKVKMIEADMQLGVLINGTGERIPIMAHDADTPSDLSFEDFITQIIESNNNRENPSDIQGAKLDFKTIETFEPALKILRNFTEDQINFPIWLNADILSGPVNSSGTPVNATEFLRLASQYRPSDTLSIGWKTSLPKNETDIGTYTAANVEEMVNLLKDQETVIGKSTPITFPLRAGFAAESLDNIMTLMKGWENSTITLWGSNNDPVDARKLKTLINTVTKARCFVDLPFDYWKDKDNGAPGIIGTSSTAILTFLPIFYYLF